MSTPSDPQDQFKYLPFAEGDKCWNCGHWITYKAHPQAGSSSGYYCPQCRAFPSIAKVERALKAMAERTNPNAQD